MTEDEVRSALVAIWLRKAEEALASAELVLGAGHLAFAVNRLYYACFYAVTALLLAEGKQFTRHSAVRAEFNRSYVKPGRIDKRWGQFYNDLFDERQEGDYVPTATFEPEDISSRSREARQFLDILHVLISPA